MENGSIRDPSKIGLSRGLARSPTELFYCLFIFARCQTCYFHSSSSWALQFSLLAGWLTRLQGRACENAFPRLAWPDSTSLLDFPLRALKIMNAQRHQQWVFMHGITPSANATITQVCTNILTCHKLIIFSHSRPFLLILCLVDDAMFHCFPSLVSTIATRWYTSQLVMTVLGVNAEESVTCMGCQGLGSGITTDISFSCGRSVKRN